MIYSSQIHSTGGREQEYLAGWQRARAELANYRTRAAQEKLEQKDRLKRELTEPLLDLADTFQAVATHLPKELKDHTWAQGVMHVVRKLEQILQEYEIVTVGKVGDQFDPLYHEAIGETKTNSVPAGHIAEVAMSGYALGRHVIRPARVKIAS